MDMLQHLIARLRLKQLELICLLADYGTLRAAAKVLNMTPAAASKSLREIESVLQVPLFQRNPGGMALTHSGTLVFDYAKGTLDNTRALIQNINIAKKARPPIQIASPPFIAWTLLPLVLEKLYQEAEFSPVKIHEERLSGSSKLLESNAIDILVTMKSPSELASLDLQNYFVKKILRQRWHVVCASDHPLASRQATLSWSDLANESWILPPYPTYTRVAFNQIIHKQGLKPIIPLVEAMNATTTSSLIKGKIGIGLLSQNVIASLATQNVLATIPVEPALDNVDIVFICKKNSQDRPEINRFLHACQQVAGTLAG